MFAVLIPVGPGSREVDRLRDALDSLRAFEDPTGMHLILVDDSYVPRDFATEANQWASCEVIRTGLWAKKKPGLAHRLARRPGHPQPYSAMVAGTIDGLRAAAEHEPEFVLKLDTDALLIGPVAARLRAIFANERVAVVGAYKRWCNGARRDWSDWAKRLRKQRRAISPIAIGPGRALRYRSPRNARAVRTLLRRAQANGYVLGAHCLGGAYAVGPALLRREDLLDWRPWVGTGLSEDVVVGLLAGAAGVKVDESVSREGVFGVGFRTLPLPPPRLVAEGYGIVHPVRNQGYGGETELRRYFRQRRSPADAISG
jgi:hypothetical protein